LAKPFAVAAFKLAEQYWTGKILEQNLRPAVAITSATTVVLTWSSIRGMKQTVQCSPDLVTWSDASLPAVTYDTACTWTDTAATPISKFYRILSTAP
jgi:hypothetical protein